MFKFNKKNLSDSELKAIFDTLMKDFNLDVTLDIMSKGLKMSKESLLEKVNNL